MKTAVWAGCVLWLAAAVGVAGLGAWRAPMERRALAFRRLKSPTLYLFAGYLLVAAFATPRSEGESTSPLLLLAVALPVCYALAAFASVTVARPRLGTSLGLAVLCGGAVLAAAAIVLALASPRFVPALLRP